MRAYDDLNRLVSVIQPDPDDEGELSSPVTEYGYNKAGNLLTLPFARQQLDHRRASGQSGRHCRVAAEQTQI